MEAWNLHIEFIKIYKLYESSSFPTVLYTEQLIPSILVYCMRERSECGSVIILSFLSYKKEVGMSSFTLFSFKYYARLHRLRA